MNKKEAIAELTYRLEEAKELFCPLINGSCVPECVCFYPGEIRNTRANLGVVDDWNITEPGCRNAMFFGGNS